MSWICTDRTYVRNRVQYRFQLSSSVNGDTFLVLDYVEGEDLSSWLSREAPANYGVEETVM